METKISRQELQDLLAGDVLKRVLIFLDRSQVTAQRLVVTLTIRRHIVEVADLLIPINSPFTGDTEVSVNRK